MYQMSMTPISQMENLYFSILFPTQLMYTPRIHLIIGSDFNIIKSLKEKKGRIAMFTKIFFNLYHQIPKVVSIKVLKH